MNQIATVIPATHAKFNITYRRQNGDLPDPVSFDLTDTELRRIATEAVRAGHVPGLAADTYPAFTDFVVDRFPATEDMPYNRLMIRPKTPFGEGEFEIKVGTTVLVAAAAKPDRIHVIVDKNGKQSWKLSNPPPREAKVRSWTRTRHSMFINLDDGSRVKIQEILGTK